MTVIIIIRIAYSYLYKIITNTEIKPMKSLSFAEIRGSTFNCYRIHNNVLVTKTDRLKFN